MRNRQFIIFDFILGEIWFVCDIIMSYGSFSDLIKIILKAIRDSNGVLEGDMNFLESARLRQLSNQNKINISYTCDAIFTGNCLHCICVNFKFYSFCIFGKHVTCMFVIKSLVDFSLFLFINMNPRILCVQLSFQRSNHRI